MSLISDTFEAEFADLYYALANRGIPAHDANACLIWEVAAMLGIHRPPETTSRKGQPGAPPSPGVEEMKRRLDRWRAEGADPATKPEWSTMDQAKALRGV